jgi:hypothetical protein
MISGRSSHEIRDSRHDGRAPLRAPASPDLGRPPYRAESPSKCGGRQSQIAEPGRTRLINAPSWSATRSTVRSKLQSDLQKTDVVIIGAGHNGLVCAAYLARAGRRVLVLERRELVGGCAVTEEIWPGYHVSTASYLTSLLQERVIRDLELARFGYRVDAKDPAFFRRSPTAAIFSCGRIATGR